MRKLRKKLSQASTLLLLEVCSASWYLEVVVVCKGVELNNDKDF